MTPVTYFQSQNSDSTYYAAMRVFDFKHNFVTEGFDECTTIYSQKA
jgi:hypothetical protein